MPESVGRGDVLSVRLDLRATQPLWYEPRATLQLRGAAGTASSGSITLGTWVNPPPFWQPDDRIRQELPFVVPADLPPGRYDAWLAAEGRTRGWIVAPVGLAQREERPRGEYQLGTVTMRP